MPLHLSAGGLAKVLLGSALGVTFAYSAAADAWVSIKRKQDPAAVLHWRPDDAVALGRLSDIAPSNDPKVAVSAEQAESARRSLVDRPLSRTSLRLIGLWAASRNDLDQADAAMALSDRVSKRDAVTQLWLIERAVHKNDVAGALAHYHAVMSVSPRARPMLFPILTVAISNGEIRAGLAPYIARPTNWAVDLLGAATNDGDPRNVALLVLPIASRLREDSFQVTNTLLVSRLARDGNIALAQQFVKAVWPDLDASALTDFAVTPATTDRRLGALAWTFNTANGVAAAPSGNGAIEINVDPLVRETAATRVVPVEGGRPYEFIERVRHPDDSPAVSVLWRASCMLPAGKPQIWQYVPRSSDGDGRDRARIEVPEGCNALEFVLSVSGPEGQSQGAISIEVLDFRPV